MLPKRNKTFNRFLNHVSTKLRTIGFHHKITFDKYNSIMSIFIVKYRALSSNMTTIHRIWCFELIIFSMCQYNMNYWLLRCTCSTISTNTKISIIFVYYFLFVLSTVFEEACTKLNIIQQNFYFNQNCVLYWLIDMKQILLNYRAMGVLHYFWVPVMTRLMLLSVKTPKILNTCNANVNYKENNDFRTSKQQLHRNDKPPSYYS